MESFAMMERAVRNGKLGIHPPPQADSIDRFRRLINSEPALTCPFLGLRDDPETLTNYASEENQCHCKGRPRAIPLDHQQMYCLFEYTRCSTFLKRMTAEVQARERAERISKGQTLKPSLGVVGTLTNLLGIK
jgi:hypothetical protein